jgi:hypothetical protein
MPDIPSDVANPVVVLAGPGVIPHAGALRRWAEAANLPVANTWSVKGLFRWDSPHHMGTVGLQERDFELAGFGAADRIIAVGVDERETPRERWALAPVTDVDAADLPSVGTHPPIEPNDLYASLAAVIQPLYTSHKTPPSPAQVLYDLGGDRRTGQVIAARPGPTGFWLGRAFPTTELGSVVIADDPPAGATVIEWGPDEVDWSDTDRLVEVAGPIVAWT